MSIISSTTARITGLTALVAAAVTLLTQWDALANHPAQPFVLKASMAAQQSEAVLLRQLDRVDELQYRAEVLRNQLPDLRRMFAVNPTDADLKDRIDRTVQSIDKMDSDRELLQCLLRKLGTCEQNP